MPLSLEKLTTHQRSYIKRWGRVVYNRHYNHVKKYDTLSDFITTNKKNDFHYFSKDTIKFWGSEIIHFDDYVFIDRVRDSRSLFYKGSSYVYKVCIACANGSVANFEIKKTEKDAIKELKRIKKLSINDIEEVINII